MGIAWSAFESVVMMFKYKTRPRAVWIKRYEAGSSQPSAEALRKIAKCFGVTTDWLLFDDGERGPDEDLRLQFEAMGQLSPEEKGVARAVLEGLLLKHAARRFATEASV
jgi:transcriptional regulator with XRE-family HTH domain